MESRIHSVQKMMMIQKEEREGLSSFVWPMMKFKR